MGSIPGLTLSLCLILYKLDNSGSARANLLKDFFRPMKCGPSSPSMLCGNRDTSLGEPACRDLGCCFANATCYKKIPNRSRMILNYGIVVTVLLLLACSVGCLCYIRYLKKLKDEGSKVKEADLTRLLMKLLSEDSETE